MLQNAGTGKACAPFFVPLIRCDETERPPVVDPIKVVQYANGGLVLEPRRQHEHGREKLGQHLALRLGDDTPGLGLIPVEHEAVCAFAFRVAIGFARDREVARPVGFQFTHALPSMPITGHHGHEKMGGTEMRNRFDSFIRAIAAGSRSYDTAKNEVPGTDLFDLFVR